jgi:hypothetical protein
MRDTTVNGPRPVAWIDEAASRPLVAGALRLVLPDDSKIGVTLAVIWDRGLAIIVFSSFPPLRLRSSSGRGASFFTALR